MAAFEKIKRGLEEARTYGKGERTGFVVHEAPPVDARATREKPGIMPEQE